MVISVSFNKRHASFKRISMTKPMKDFCVRDLKYRQKADSERFAQRAASGIEISDL